MVKQPAVYILASKRNGTVYIGVTSNLQQRIWQRKGGFIEGFTERYAVHILVYYELDESLIAAITREKQIEEMEPCLETEANRREKSTVARLVRRNLNTCARPGFPPSRE
jgi:putative endonuclease